MINVDWSIVSADYFQTMNVPILQGRTFSKDEDEQGKKAVLVDETGNIVGEKDRALKG